jgi:hypothetical protein
MQTVWMGVLLEMILEKKLPSTQNSIRNYCTDWNCISNKSNSK